MEKLLLVDRFYIGCSMVASVAKKRIRSIFKLNTFKNL